MVDLSGQRRKTAAGKKDRLFKVIDQRVIAADIWTPEIVAASAIGEKMLAGKYQVVLGLIHSQINKIE